MITTPTTIQDFLETTSPFDQLSPAALKRVAAALRPLRYRMGQAILVPDTLPTQLYLIYQGQVRLLGYDPRTGSPVTLKRLQAGETVGEAGLVRGVPCETAIASTETYCLILPARTFLSLLDQEPAFAAAFQEEVALCEIFDLLGKDLAQRADGQTDLKALTFRAWPEAVVYSLPPGQSVGMYLDPERVWFLSSGTLPNSAIGKRLVQEDLDQNLRVKGPQKTRLIGLRTDDLHDPDGTPAPATSPGAFPWADVPTAPDHPPRPEETPETAKQLQYPFMRGRGPIDAPLACFGMLAQHLELPFRRDVIRRILAAQVERGGTVSLPLCGAVAEVMGLKAQLVEAPADVFPRLQAPALILYQGSLALVYHISAGEIVLALPEQGLRRLKPATFLDQWALEIEGQESGPENHPVLLLEPTRHTPQQRFSLRWFWPSVQRHRKVLIEVLIASFFVQLFALANPLATQVIIDKVLVQNSLSTLHVLGIFLVVVALFEALLSSFRTYLFVDTTNRIDLVLGSEVIDHLLRLPLRYFERRPVGELASRVNELENIRQFLTGTALTVVLDAVFSVIYIVVMVIYSWLLTLVALATVPLFALLTFIVAPITRQQARTKAERNAETQSYLVEVVSGIQTVKAQNIELKSRWQWQERYARYVSAGFEAVATSTTAGSLSSFLNKLSSLLLLWVGAVLVLKGQLTLGQLIAFRIIAGYTTSPLLRLIQLWQNFQETALSLERLADILDHPQEVSEADRSNIPMPAIRGAVRFDDISFAFADKGPLQLKQIGLEFAAGTFVGIAGQSGSGKSTLVKLLMRLYDPQGGRILVDGYDIHKVELYSLRRQIGMVLQDSLLFDGTVQENIALTRPDATAEEIIEAARIAYAHGFIMELPQGYNTRVGERGSALSGGQRQRIAIARAVLQNPQLLILDEATSALDYNAEHQVCLNLREAFQGRTVFFITHRLSTLKPADVIVLMDQGRVAEQGTHEALMALQGAYYCLYQQQEAQA